MKKHEVNLGSPAKPNAEKDAVHIAVIPMIANEILFPGQHVGIVDKDKTKVGHSDKPIGIVDPFRTSNIFPESRVWILLYQNSISSLRHERTHPDFEESNSEEIDSLEWLRDFADTAGLSYSKLMSAAKDYLESGEYLLGGEEWEGFGCPDEFWDHYEKVTGETVDEDNRGSFFSCAC